MFFAVYYEQTNISGKMCVPGHWVPPLLMTFFLLVANILLMSMLLAIFKLVYRNCSKGILAGFFQFF